MIDCQKLAAIAPLREGATAKDLSDIQITLGYNFPISYVELLTCSNGFFYSSSTTNPPNVYFYPVSKIVERNETFAIAKYTPTLLLIGDDLGGRGFFLDKEDEKGSLYLRELGDPFRENAICIASSIEEWLNNGFYLEVDDEDNEEDSLYPKLVDVYLAKPPTDGAKSLIDLKNFLGLNESIVALRLAYEQLPYRLLRNVPFGKYAKICGEYNRKDPCLALFEVDQPDKPIEIPERFLKTL